MGSVRTSILGRPRPLPGHRRADRPYTLICDEPSKRADAYAGPAPAKHRRATANTIEVPPTYEEPR